MKTAMIIYNPNAGGGIELALINQLELKLNNTFDSIVIKETNAPGDATRFAKQASMNQVDSIFAIGGDGTFNEVVNGIAEQDYRPKLGLLPGGTNNTYLRTLQEELDLEKAIEEMDIGSTDSIDIGRCNDAYFIYYVAFGNLLNATMGTSIEEKEEKGSLAYIENIIREVPDDILHNISLSVDGGESEIHQVSHFFSLLTNYYGPVQLTDSDNAINDGYIYNVLLLNSTLGAKLQVMKDVLFGNLTENENIKLIKCQSYQLEITEDTELKMDLDGDVGPDQPLNVHILPKHVEIYRTHGH